MADKVIPIEMGNTIFQRDEQRTVQGGGTRLVPLVPVSNDGSTMPCIWKSRYIIQAELADGNKVAAHECLLLVSRNPILTMRAEVAVDSWQHFGQGPVEW